MWNNTDTPIGFFISFRAYGTWPHGDERGSTDRHNNKYGTPRYAKNDRWKDASVARLKHPPVRLDAARRQAILKAIRETCEKRGWILYAVNIRTNHVHIVIAATGVKTSGLALNAFKANATRIMREDGCWTLDSTPWADRGSKPPLWTQRNLDRAIDYVLNSQGDDLPEFD